MKVHCDKLRDAGSERSDKFLDPAWSSGIKQRQHRSNLGSWH
jgi:hypothetical protein